jgi:hypothetical protein
MDVGADNFRFDLDTKNGLKGDAGTYRQPATTELHIDSLDRYLPSMLAPNTLFAPYTSQTVAKLAGPNYLPTTLSGVNMNISNGRPLVYGYFGRVALTQFMLKRSRPTVLAGGNDTFSIAVASSAVGPVVASVNITIPQGFYTIAELAVELQNRIQISTPFLAQAYVLAPGAVGNANGAGFVLGTGNPSNFMAVIVATGLSESTMIARLKTLRMLGFTRPILGFPNVNTSAALATPTYYLEAAGSPPNLLPTDYVDIVSTALTNYKDAKDANSSIGSPGAVLGRVWMVESAVNNSNSPADLLNIGSEPITVMKTWTSPNWCQWSPNQTLNSLDIRLIDMWGDVINWTSSTPTEWSATLTFTE